MKISCLLGIGSILTGGGAGAWAADAGQVDFMNEVKPILESACLRCHYERKEEGEYRMDTQELAFKGGQFGQAVVPGRAEASALYVWTILPQSHKQFMPPPKDDEPLEPSQTEVLKNWINQGFEWPEGVQLEPIQRIHFVKHIQPILEQNCVQCHRDDNAEEGFNMTTREKAMSTGKNAPSLIPFHAEKSAMHFLTALAADDESRMPPIKEGGPLSKRKTDMIRDWIEQGAPWPEGIVLVPREPPAETEDTDMLVVQRVFERIMANFWEVPEDEMEPYVQEIPGAEVSFPMVPIPGGTFVMGSPENEPGRNADEGPQHKVKINPFWMGAHEVTWNEFELFMYPQQEKKLRELHGADPVADPLSDTVARPSQPYVEMSFGMGKEDYPAISMTQHAASLYCLWLSAKTGIFYRLPTEAEWEYACRAGSTTAWSWGDDPEQIDDYAWYEENSDWKYQKVGKKKPNAWGLYDMHGNVAEWVLDQYQPAYSGFEGDEVHDNPWVVANSLYPRTVRGGSWDDPPERLRSAARRGSSSAWKMQDPQLPQSIWYLTDAQFLGFRVVSPVQIPDSPEAMTKWWFSAKGAE